MGLKRKTGNGWPFPRHDSNGWRYANVDIKPPLKLSWEWESKTKVARLEVTGTGGQAFVVLSGGRVVCLNADGSVKWTSKATRIKKGSEPAFSAYVTDHGIIVVHWGGVECLDAGNGSLIWSVVDEHGRDILRPRTEAHRGLRDTDFANGLAWCRKDGNLVFVSQSGAIRVLGARDGCLKHVRPTWAGPLAYGGGLLMGCIRATPGEDVEKQLMDLERPEVIERLDKRCVPSSCRELCRVRDKLVIPGDTFLACVDASNGRMTWLVDYTKEEEDIRYDNAMYVATDGECIYALRDYSRIAAYRLSDGARKWVTPVSSGPFSTTTPFVLSRRHIYVQHSELRIDALDKETGETVWGSDRVKTTSAYNLLSIPNGGLCLTDEKSILCFEGS